MPSTKLNGACGRSLTMLEFWSYSWSSSFFKTEACLRVIQQALCRELAGQSNSRVGRLIHTDSSVGKQSELPD